MDWLAGRRDGTEAELARRHLGPEPRITRGMPAWSALSLRTICRPGSKPGASGIAASLVRAADDPPP